MDKHKRMPVMEAVKFILWVLLVAGAVACTVLVVNRADRIDVEKANIQKYKPAGAEEVTFPSGIKIRRGTNDREIFQNNSGSTDTAGSGDTLRVGDRSGSGGTADTGELRGVGLY